MSAPHTARSGAAAGLDRLELEHVMGFSAAPNSLQTLPGPSPALLHTVGPVIVLTDMSDLQLQELLIGHDGDVITLACAPNGALIASGQVGTGPSKEAAVIVWTAQTRQEALRLPGHSGSVTSLAYSPDSRYLATADEAGRFSIWDAATGAPVTSIKLDVPAAVTVWLAIDPGRSRTPTYTLASVGGTVARLHRMAFDPRLMNYTLSSEPVSMPGGMMRSFVSAAAFGGGQWLAAGSNTSDVCIFDMVHKIFRAQIPVGSNGVRALLDLGPAGLLIGCGDGTLRRMRGADRAWITEAECKLEGRVASLTVLGGDVVAGCGNGVLYRLSAASLTGQTMSVHPVASTTAVAFGDSPEFMWVGSADGTVTQWSLSTYLPVVVCRHRAPVACLAADELGVLVGWTDGSIRLFGTDRSRVWEVPTAHRGAVTSVACSLAYLVSGGEDGCVRVWGRKRGEFLHQFQEHKGAVLSVVTDCNTSQLIHSCGADRSILSYDLNSQRRVSFHAISGSNFTQMAQQRNKQADPLLVTVTADSKMMAWDIDYPQPLAAADFGLRTARGAMRLMAVAVSPSGRYAAVGVEDGTVLVVDVTAKLAVLAMARAHSVGCRAVAWSPDERQLVSASVDGSLCVWNFYP